MSHTEQIATIVATQKVINTVEMDAFIQEAKEWAAANKEDKELLKNILNLIDLTTLEGTDTPNKVTELCQKALSIPEEYNGLPTVAAICVYPYLVATAQKEISNSTLGLASVATGFPSGQTFLAVKEMETSKAIEAGATEIDMVISRGAFLSGNYHHVFEEIIAIQELCSSKARLKVILETGELETLENIRLASDLAITAQADFIKTSTGKVSQGASLEAIYVMLTAIKDNFTATNRKVGIKPSGGISTPEVALQYYKLVELVVGKEWLTNTLFRFGASSLAGNVLYALTGDEMAKSYFKSKY